jgi:hypothetical protein
VTIDIETTGDSRQFWTADRIAVSVDPYDHVERSTTFHAHGPATRNVTTTRQVHLTFGCGAMDAGLYLTVEAAHDFADGLDGLANKRENPHPRWRGDTQRKIAEYFPPRFSGGSEQEVQVATLDVGATSFYAKGLIYIFLGSEKEGPGYPNSNLQLNYEEALALAEMLRTAAGPKEAE